MINSLSSRSPAAERMRRHRERRRRGPRCLMIELRETDVDALICGGLLEHATHPLRLDSTRLRGGAR